MTLEEAKKILEKEGFKLGGPGNGKPGVVSEAFAEYEAPEICEAMQIVCSAGFQLAMLAGVFDERKERLKKEYEKNTKAPVSGKEQPKEKKGIIYPTTFPKADFYYKHVLEEGNPALKESASQFNDALLDEQAKKIAELTKEKSNLEDQITVLNACKKHNDKIDRKQIKCLGKEIARLNGIIHDKNAILADVAEELRLTKIREKNLAELGLKYVGENEKLKKELADKVVDKIDAQALKSAESALAWKEKVVTYKDMALAYDEKKIADLGKELKAQKDLVDDISLKYDGAKHNLKLRIEECEKLKKELEKMTKLVETVRKGSKEYCDYGIAAEKMIQKMAKEIVNDSPVPSKDYEQYRLWANGCRFNPHLPDFSEEEEIRALKLQISALEKRGNGIDWKRNADAIKLYVNRASRERLWNPINQDICNEQELSFIINHGGKRVKYALRFDGTDIVYECSDPDKKPRIPTPELSEEELMKLQEKACVDIAEEGKDQSAIIVQCDNGITLSKEEAEIIERCTKNGTELHYSEKDGLTYTNMFGEEIPIRCLRGIFHVFTDEEIKNMKK